jgi:hypothetical protein
MLRQGRRKHSYAVVIVNGVGLKINSVAPESDHRHQTQLREQQEFPQYVRRDPTCFAKPLAIGAAVLVFGAPAIPSGANLPGLGWAIDVGPLIVGWLIFAIDLSLGAWAYRLLYT